MAKSYEVSKEDAAKIKKYRKGIKDKVIDRRLYAVELRGEGMRNQEVAEKLDVDKRQVSMWVRKYKNGGIEALHQKRGGRHHENLSVEKEKEILDKFKAEAKKGRIVEVSEIKKAYDEAVGRDTGTQIYNVLHRHKWRKVMPRSKHPKKASEEAIEASKKLT